MCPSAGRSIFIGLLESKGYRQVLETKMNLVFERP